MRALLVILTLLLSIYGFMGCGWSADLQTEVLNTILDINNKKIKIEDLFEKSKLLKNHSYEYERGSVKDKFNISFEIPGKNIKGVDKVDAHAAKIRGELIFIGFRNERNGYDALDCKGVINIRLNFEEEGSIITECRHILNELTSTEKFDPAKIPSTGF